MAGTNILVRQKDLIAGSGISITPDATSGNVTIAATSTAIDESRLVPTGGKEGEILSYQEGADRGNSDNVRLLLQNALTDSANGNAAPAAVTTQGVTLTGDNNLLFDGNDSHVTAVLATDEIFAADKEWTIDFWMKPTANSSEWNYILTENTGDWGSHSIGLTWNSDDSTLEQDTGGYLASVIRSSNWPNDAVACAADQWHFVVVEKQKTSTGWSLNYYLNGAIWLQVAFTGEFVPFDSSNPFWFGGKTTDSGRWFKGEANKLRVTTGARYGGKAFTVPDRLTDYAAPAGQPVWVDGIDRSRLLPEDPANGDIPVYDATVTGGGIDEYTQVCFHFDEADGAFKNAVDDSAEYVESTAAYSAQGKFGGAVEFDGSQRIKYSKAAALNWGAGQGTVDGWFYPNGTQNSSNALIATPGSWSSGGISIGFDRSNTRQKFSVWMHEASSDMAWSSTEEYPRNAWYHWALVRPSATELLFFVNGKKIGTIEIGSDREIDWSNGDGYCTIGYNEADSNAGVIGRMDEVRLSNTARWTEDFTPPAVPYSEQVAEGRWGKMSSSGLVSIAAPANGDIPCFDATATTGGGNDANTRLLLQPSTSDHGIVDQAAGNAAPVTLENHNVTVDEEGNMVFDGSNAYLKIPANTLPSDFFNGTDEWTLDIVYNVASKGMQCLFGCSSSLRMDFLLDSDGSLQIGAGPNLGTGWPFNEDVHLTFEIYKDGTVWKYTIFRNGSVVTTGTWVNADWRSVAQYIGWEGESDSRKINGKIKALRLTSGALHKGAAFQSDYPWTKPQTVGEWGKINKSELVQSVNGVAPNESGNVILDASTIIDNSRLLPVLDALPEGYEGSLLAVQRGDGKVADENTLRLMHFNDDVRDVVTDETGTLKGNASITPTGYFAGALSINHAVVSSLSFNGLTATPTAWTMDFRVKLGRFSGNAPLVLIGTNLNETQTSLIRVDSSYIDIQATYNQRVIYKTHSLQLDTWYHFALTYDGTTYKFYVDGKLFGSGESANQFDFTRKLWFGSFYDYSTSYVSDCTIDEFRLSNVVRWTENFTPPDAPYGKSLYNWGIGPKLDESRLLPETGSVSSDSVGNPVIFKAISRIDNTYWLCLPLNEDTNDRSTYDVATGVYGTVNIVSNAPSSPGGSAFFNGSSCLHGTLPAQFGASDFTVRFWMMAPEMNSSTFPQTIFSTRYGNETSGSTFALHCTTEGRLFIYSNGDITSRTDTPFTLQSGIWYHVAVVRKSGVLTIYVNGEVYNSATFTNPLTRQIFGLGASWASSSYSEAGTVYLTSLDVLNYAAYDGAFTTPAYQPGILAGMGYQVAEKGFVPSDSKQLLPANPDDQDLTIYRVFPEEAAPQNLTSATSDPNWEVTWSGAYSGRVGWWAFDSDQSTMWCTYQAAVGDWLCWEYKGVEGKVLLRRYSIAKASGNGDCPTGWKIQGSNDGSIWVDLDEQTGQSFPDNNAKEYTIPNNSAPYKFHRFYLLSWNTSNMIGTFKAWSWINSTEERKVWLPINKSEFVVNDARLLPGAPSDTTNSYWLNSGPVATQVSPASYAGSTDATWTMELSGAFEDGDISTLFDSDTTNGVSGTLGLETFGTVRWIRKDQVPYRIDRIVLRAQNSDIGAFPKTIYLSGYDKSTFSTEIVQEFNAPVWETESDTSTYATSSFTRVCTLEVNAPAFQSYDYSIALGSGSGLETTLQAFAAYQLDTETAWKQLNTATTTTAGLMAAADKVKLDALQQAATYINIATDFDTYKTAGSYFLKSAVHTNGPLTDSYAGTLVVVAPAELRYTTQYFTQLYTNKTFVRTYSRENSAWSAWNRVLVDTDLATTTVAGLMSATDREKSIGLTTRGFYPNALAKSGAVDFNEVIDHGFYFIGGDTPHLNYPETYQQSGGTLQVIGTGNYLTQTFIPLNINTVFIRTCVNALSDSSVRTFSAWRRALTAPDITESKAQPGYFKLPNGTIVQWGSFVITADPQIQEITLPVALSSIYSKQVSGSNSSLKIGIYGGTNGKITCYVEGSTSGTVDWMVIGK